MTGFTVFIDERKLVPLDISVDEALRVTVSAGVLVPASEQPEDIEGRLRSLGVLGARASGATPAVESAPAGASPDRAGTVEG